MLRYRVKSLPPKYPYPSWRQREAFVILRVEDREQMAPYEVEGDPQFAASTRRVLQQSWGHAGRSLEEVTNADELNCAMFDAMMRPYQPERIEGDEIFAKE